MALATRIFVYELLSGGGDTAGGESAGELLGMGRAMRDAMVADLLALKSYHVTVAACKQAPVRQVAQSVMPHDGEAPGDFVRRQARAHDFSWVVAPETDGLLAALHPCVPPGRWLGCALPAIALATRKRSTLVALAAAGVTTPSAFAHEAAGRWVVKPDDGAGAVDTRVHRQRIHALDDWHARMGTGQPSLMEPWVEGEALSLSLMCRASGCELLSINRQQLHIDTRGFLSFVGVQAHAIALADARGATLAALAARVHRAMPGLRGFVGIDLVWHATRGPVVIEVNPRVTCAYVGLSALLGRNLAADMIACHAADAKEREAGEEALEAPQEAARRHG